MSNLDIHTYPTVRYSTPKQVNLKPHQVSHFERAIDHLSRYRSFLDSSPTGSGKTFTTAKIIQHLNTISFGQYAALVICPNQAKGIWEDTFNEYGIPYYDIFSFEYFRGQTKTKSNLRHKYLKLNSEREDATRKFEPGEDLTYIANEQRSIIFIIDEVHQSKNLTTNYGSVVTVSTYLTLKSQQSKIISISASPASSPEEIVRQLKILGLFTSRSLYEVFSSGKKSSFKPTGIEELVKLAEFVSPTLGKKSWEIEIDKFLSENIPTSDYSNKYLDLAFYLFIDYFRPMFVFSMDDPEIPVEHDLQEGYYPIGNRFYDYIARQAVDKVKAQISHDQFGRAKVTNWSSISEGILLYETAMLEIIKRESFERLSENPNNKVIILLHRKKSIDNLMYFFEKGSIPSSYVTGDVKYQVRKQIIAKFQEHNSDMRVIILTMKLGNVSISLHDTNGNYPRHMYMTPNYGVTMFHQSSGRPYRVGTLSVPHTRLVQSRDHPITRILDTIYMRSSYLQESVDVSSAKRVMFPGDYPYSLILYDTDSDDKKAYYLKSIRNLKKQAEERKVLAVTKIQRNEKLKKELYNLFEGYSRGVVDKMSAHQMANDLIKDYREESSKGGLEL